MLNLNLCMFFQIHIVFFVIYKWRLLREFCKNKKINKIDLGPLVEIIDMVFETKTLLNKFVNH